MEGGSRRGKSLLGSAGERRKDRIKVANAVTRSATDDGKEISTTRERGDAPSPGRLDYWLLERSEGREINLRVELFCVPPRARRYDANFP